MERRDFIDYAKAFGILFVLLPHVGFSAASSPLLFAMPAFFAATGYTFSFGKRSIGENIALRFKTVMLPYFIMMLIYTPLEMLRAKLFGYGGASIALPALLNTAYGSGIIPFGGIFEKIKLIMSYKAQPQTGLDLILPANCHLWFLPAMFTAYMIFNLLVKPLRGRHLLKVLAIIALLLFTALEVTFPNLCQLPLALGRGALGAAFMLFGFWLKDYRLLDGRSKSYYILTNALAIALFSGSLYLGSDGSAWVRSVYGPYGVWSVFVTFIGGAAGIWLIFSFCRLIEMLPLGGVKKLLSYTGKNIMTVYVWHMAVKFVFDAFYVCIIKGSDFSLLDDYKMGLMPQGSWLYMIFEIVAVIALCLIIAKLKKPKKA